MNKVTSTVHYTWLGTDPKKTYIILSLYDSSKVEAPKRKTEELVKKYSARIAGFIAAMYFTNNEAAQEWLRALAYLLQP